MDRFDVVVIGAGAATFGSSGGAWRGNPGGVISAGNFGAFTAAGPGSWLEIYGTNLSTTSRSWAAADFGGSIAAGAKAPTSLDGVSVSVGGQAAYVSYISPGQIDAQIPASVGTGPQPVIVTAGGVASAPFTMTINAVQPGLLAPPSFMVGGKQYLVMTTDEVLAILD
jgi:uncharacterized protein (TIGR03437 family)